MTIIAQDDHLTAGAWAACGLTLKILLVLNRACALLWVFVRFFESSSWVNKPFLPREVSYRRRQTRKK